MEEQMWGASGCWGTRVCARTDQHCNSAPTPRDPRESWRKRRLLEGNKSKEGVWVTVSQVHRRSVYIQTVRFINTPVCAEQPPDVTFPFSLSGELCGHWYVSLQLPLLLLKPLPPMTLNEPKAWTGQPPYGWGWPHEYNYTHVLLVAHRSIQCLRLLPTNLQDLQLIQTQWLKIVPYTKVSSVPLGRKAFFYIKSWSHS